MSLNVCGLFSKLKYGNFESMIKEFDFVCISEAKTNFIAPDEFEDFYSFMSKKSSKLAILAHKKNDKFYELLKNTTSKHVIWLLVGKNSKSLDFVLGAVYIPRAASIDSSEKIFEEIFLDIVEIEAKYDLPFILMGDFNARTSVVSDFLDFEVEISDYTGYSDNYSQNLKLLNLCKRFNSDKKDVDINGKGVINLCKNFNMNIVNGRFGSDKGVGDFTCFKSEAGTVIDYVLASDCLLPHVTDFAIGNFDQTLSDVHCPLFFGISDYQDSNNSSINIQESVNVQKQQIFIKKWKPGINDQFKNSFSPQETTRLHSEIDRLYNTSSTSQEDVDGLVCEINSLFIETAKSVGLCKNPRKTTNYTRIFPNKPWFNNSCEARRRGYLNLKFKKHGKNWKKTLSANFKQYKSFLDNQQRIFKKETETKLRALKNTDPREYWKIINYACKNKGQKECNISMDELYAHFKNLSFKEQVDSQFDPTTAVHEDSISEELNSPFTVEEIQQVIKKLKNNKSSGLDQILNEYLKNCPVNVVKLIVKLFNLILDTGLIPEEWCKGLINPLYKNKGSIKNVDNYRGITLLSCIGKLFTSAFNFRLSLFVIHRGTLEEDQAGSRAGYGTVDHMFVLDVLIQLYKSRYGKLFCCFVDYRKAFDLVDRSDLWMKLTEIEVNGKFMRVIYNLYAHAKSCVKKGNDISDFFLCNIGVRQGENLSPLLFVLFLNDFSRHISTKYRGLSSVSDLCSMLLSDDDVTVFVRLFALLYMDDTIVMAETEEQLQNALVGVYEYCVKWHLKINVDKTKVVIFSRGKIRNHRNFFLRS